MVELVETGEEESGNRAEAGHALTGDMAQAVVSPATTTQPRAPFALAR